MCIGEAKGWTLLVMRRDLDAKLLAVSRVHHLCLRVLFLNGARALAATLLLRLLVRHLKY